MLTLVISSLVFVAVLLAVERLLRVITTSTRKDKEVNKRLQMLKASGSKLDTYDELLRMRGLSKSDTRVLSSDWFNEVYVQSGLRASFTVKAMFVIACGIVGYIVGRMFLSNTYFLAIFAGICVVVLPILFVLYVRSKRSKKFVKQLSNAIEVMIRSLAAGHPLPAAINLVANEMQDPIGTEFGILSDELTYGIELDDAMLNMVQRVGLDETKILAVSISVQRGTGGNLIEILENLSVMIRGRLMMKAKIKAISAEGRITAVIMSMFPFFLFLMIRALVPTYFDPLWDSGYGTTIISICGILMVFGIFILYRLVKFDF